MIVKYNLWKKKTCIYILNFKFYKKKLYVYMLTSIEIFFGKTHEGGYVLRCVSTPLGRLFWNRYAFACMEETFVMLACIPCTKSNSLRVSNLD